MTHVQKLSRRTVLAGGVGTLALLVLAPQVSTAGTSDPYSYAAWLPLLGSDVTADGGAMLRVARVEDLRRPAREGEVDSGADRFRLHFTLVSGTFASDTLTVMHPQAGAVDLFTTQSHTNQGHTTQNGTADGIASAVACIDRRGSSLLPPQH